MKPKSEISLAFNDLNVPVLVVNLSLKGVPIVEVNEVWLKLHKGDRKVIVGQPLTDLITFERQYEIEEKILLAKEKRTPLFSQQRWQFGNLDSKQNQFFHSIQILPLGNHEQEQLVALVFNEAFTKEESDNYSLVINNTEEAFVLMDKDLMITAFNKQFENLYSQYFGIAIKLGESILNYALPERREGLQMTYKNVLSGLEEEAEIKIPVGDTHKIFSLKYKPAKNANDEIIGAFVSALDITHQRKAQGLIEESEEKYRVIFKFSPMPKCVYDAKTFQILDVNDAAIQKYGYPLDDFLALSIGVIFKDKDLSIIKEIGDKIGDQPAITFGVFQQLKKNKSLLTAEVSGFGFTQNGKKCIMIVCNDITDKIVAERQILENETKLKAAQKIAKLGYWQLDADGSSLFWSNEVYNIWGVSPEHYTPSFDALLKSIHPDDLELFLKEQEAYFSGKQPHDFQHRIILPTGQIKWVHEKGQLVKDNKGKVLHFEGTVQDVTVQKTVSLYLEESLQRFYYVTKATSDAIWDWDIESDSIYLGDSFKSTFGIEAENVITDIQSWTSNHIHPEDVEQIRENLKETIESDAEKWQVKYRLKKANGEYAHAAESGFVLRNASGKAIRMIAAVKDITEENSIELYKNLEGELNRIFNENVELTQCLHHILKLLEPYGNFALAEAWIISHDRTKINLLATDSVGPGVSDFYQKVHEIKSFKKGTGLPGCVWQQKQILWWNDLTTNKQFVRQKAAQESNINSAVGLPLICENIVIGVLVFGFFEKQNSLNQIRPILDKLSEQLGAAINRKQLTQELNELFKLTSDIICICDFDLYFKKINPAMSKILGYTEEELLQLNIYDLVHKDDLANIKLSMRQLKKQSTSLNFESRLITKFSETRWVSWSATSRYDERLIYTTARDISEKAVLEELLFKANKLAKIGSWEIDLKTNTLFWSDIAKEIHEVGPDFEPDLNLMNQYYRHQKDIELVETSIQQCIEKGKPWEIELEILTAKKKPKWVNIMCEGKFVDGVCISLNGSIQDIDEVKKSELKVQAVLNEKSTIVESISDAFFSVDKNFVVTYWNKEAERVLHTSKQQILGHNLWDVFNEAVDSPSYKFYHLAIETQESQHFETYYPPIDSWFEVSAYPSSFGLSVYFKDITQRKKSELQLKNMNAKLEERAKQLTAINQELEQFAYIASHDLQEPLRMVTSFLSLLEKKYNSTLDDNGRKYIHFAVDGAVRMRQIILDLLEYSRAGRVPDSIEEIDLNELLEDVILLNSNLINETNCKIKIDKLPSILAPKTALQQIFQNLINNAIKYRREAVSPSITVHYESKPDFHEFVVSDNGIGIEEEYFDKIFVIFQRLHNKDEYSGSGIGLAICKKIIDNLGGKMEVTSTINKGSNFKFSIPK